MNAFAHSHPDNFADSQVPGDAQRFEREARPIHGVQLGALILAAFFVLGFVSGAGAVLFMVAQ